MMGTAQRAFASYSSISFSQAALDGLYKGLKRDSLCSLAEPTETLSFQKEIEVRNLGFQYEGQETPLFTGLDLVVPRFAKVAFVGATGSGKTTLVNLILGLLEPTSGSIAIDGEPLSRAKIPAWQSKVGYVPQDIFLLDESVRNNIAFAVPAADIDDSTVEKAAKIAQIDDFIQQELAGGQRQRLGIARALYRDPEILVLDEATSALDGDTEEKVVAAIEALERKKTILVIAHRLKTVRNCDVIYVIRNGKISASGS